MFYVAIFYAIVGLILCSTIATQQTTILVGVVMGLFFLFWGAYLMMVTPPSSKPQPKVTEQYGPPAPQKAVQPYFERESVFTRPVPHSPYTPRPALPEAGAEYAQE